MDRDSVFGLTEEDFGYDDDDEAFEQFGVFSSSGLFSGSGYRGYSGNQIATKASMVATNPEEFAGMGMAPGSDDFIDDEDEGFAFGFGEL
jgi:hypothetical protein